MMSYVKDVLINQKEYLDTQIRDCEESLKHTENRRAHLSAELELFKSRKAELEAELKGKE